MSLPCFAYLCGSLNPTMAIVDLIMPKMGESIHEATIISWQKEIGERVEAEEPVLDVATDKVDSDVPSPVAGILIEKLAAADEIVQIGQVIARIKTGEGDSDPQVPQEDSKTTDSEVSAALTEAIPEETPTDTSTGSAAPIQEAADTGLSKAPPPSLSNPKIAANSGDQFYSPLVRNIARTEGISAEELATIKGTGGDSRITKHDIRNYILAKRQMEAASIPNPDIPPQERQTIITTPSVQNPRPQISQTKPSKVAPPKAPPQTISQATANGDEIIEMDRMRKLIASHMKHSQEVSATVTSFVEADATHLVHWRNRNKVSYGAKYGEKLTFTPLFVEAVIQSLRDYPAVNSIFTEDQLIQKRDINIGIATAMESGNLIVPVIKNAGNLNLQGLTAQLNDLTGRARVNKLKGDEITEGTFTISNIGTYGNIMGTPIINQPQLAILALGAIKKKPVIQETPHGDIIAIRHMMYLSLSFDHRVIDGYLGGTFLNRIAQYIEAFDPNRPL